MEREFFRAAARWLQIRLELINGVYRRDPIGHALGDLDWQVEMMMILRGRRR